jgi:hypothetical protein
MSASIPAYCRRHYELKSDDVTAVSGDYPEAVRVPTSPNIDSRRIQALLDGTKRQPAFGRQFGSGEQIYGALSLKSRLWLVDLQRDSQGL